MATQEVDIYKQMRRLRRLKADLELMYTELEEHFKERNQNYGDTDCQTYHTNAYDLVRYMLTELEHQYLKLNIPEDLI